MKVGRADANDTKENPDYVNATVYIIGVLLKEIHQYGGKDEEENIGDLQQKYE